MASLTVSLPDALTQWVDGCIAAGRYADASDYVRDLIRRDAEQTEDLGWLQDAIDRGMASGIDPRAPAEIFHDIRAKYAAEHG